PSFMSWRGKTCLESCLFRKLDATGPQWLFAAALHRASEVVYGLADPPAPDLVEISPDHSTGSRQTRRKTARVSTPRGGAPSNPARNRSCTKWSADRSSRRERAPCRCGRSGKSYSAKNRRAYARFLRGHRRGSAVRF